MSSQLTAAATAEGANVNDMKVFVKAMQSYMMKMKPWSEWLRKTEYEVAAKELEGMKDVLSSQKESDIALSTC